jgi:hypothetical protein
MTNNFETVLCTPDPVYDIKTVVERAVKKISTRMPASEIANSVASGNKVAIVFKPMSVHQMTAQGGMKTSRVACAEVIVVDTDEDIQIVKKTPCKSV